ncbi:ribonuclease HII [Prosthecomicrobium pneumaticum]|uniref:Ribonuclease HII n=1 Tax=Prosthecomicrobium pneumaticum TaxID=81895 RepID=A0A7W9FJY6_9HYPH|nr:ribonuclease HII [Prosthecomicrobium pneumaticum]MBB5751975.1 ribonuclease HII [Prosthecomicrobium pneumaticum]
MARRPSDSTPLLPLPEAPDDAFERRLRRDGRQWVAGVDEAGRGPLAGPVVAAAVVLPKSFRPKGLDDSKKVAPEARARLYEEIVEAACVSVAIASVARIDTMNILRASLWAMSRAIAGLSRPADHVLVDGNMLPPGLACPADALVAGDARSVSIAAASIVAKVTRDRLMAAAGARFPGYGFERHMGYGTPEHLAALGARGVCALHRRSFAPVRAALGLDRAAASEAQSSLLLATA